ncbi:MAG: alpha/beta fold hydrolase [Hoeflea sp.]|uniref:alpha/beta hydrolase n=1 Tax=Hoeflea sp. TaxID=1940281 RepID=UPI001DA60F05|nr:alpha/beta fold hydrolase [Hoeflea sp.]MBU4529748.1 alpha/beta fold hydrolase [Alphaproteobacteria bacterium]MBU4543309.1 alpha/beta fold hydrolase [Alphaproteobacteria bacterium]MBU4552496.1 alpha/beta fold hydrolase [Alphaproteobacteria bacterium]MBV1723512.1 alpha/beta fold hydrolase [Hoeflea sp.]MBV1762961.1 alpha/beta fold hydrolase [Hoeflea sp.]
MAKRTSRTRKVLYFIAFLIIAGGLAFAFGPRPAVDTSVDFSEATLPDDLDQYLAQSEAGFEDLRDGSERRIVWAYPASKARTPLAIIYIHGFSAGPGETRPLSDLIASQLGANLYYARLAGHGRSGDAMLDGSVHAWVNDLAEAVAIGRRLGERVVIVATSTGASLATWAATQPDLMRDVVGLVQISPNYGVQAAGSGLLTMPWAENLVPLIAGQRRSFEPINDLHATLWTPEYPSLALLPMASLVQLANGVDAARISVPSLFIFSPQDQVIRPELAKEKAENWGGPVQTIEVTDSDDPNNHVIAGDALSPSTTERLAAQTAEWIAGLQL